MSPSGLPGSRPSAHGSAPCATPMPNWNRPPEPRGYTPRLREFLDGLGIDRRDRGREGDALGRQRQRGALRHLGVRTRHLDHGEAAALDLAREVECGAASPGSAIRLRAGISRDRRTAIASPLVHRPAQPKACTIRHQARPLRSPRPDPGGNQPDSQLGYWARAFAPLVLGNVQQNESRPDMRQARKGSSPRCASHDLMPAIALAPAFSVLDGGPAAPTLSPADG